MAREPELGDIFDTSLEDLEIKFPDVGIDQLRIEGPLWDALDLHRYVHLGTEVVSNGEQIDFHHHHGPTDDDIVFHAHGGPRDHKHNLSHIEYGSAPSLHNSQYGSPEHDHLNENLTTSD